MQQTRTFPHPAHGAALGSPAPETRFHFSFAESAKLGHRLGAVDELRTRAYAGASYFAIKDLNPLRVAEDPQGSLVLCAWEGPTLIATLRVSEARSSEQANALLGLETPRSVALPAAVLSRGAVNPDYRGQGWMPLMITLGLIAADAKNLRCGLGVQAEGTPHQGAMLRSGWQVMEAPAVSLKSLDVKSSTHFLWLDHERFGQAIEAGLAKGGALLAQLPKRIPEQLKSWREEHPSLAPPSDPQQEHQERLRSQLTPR